MTGRLVSTLLACSLFLSGQAFAPPDVEVLGDIGYGESRGPVEYTPKPRYRAFVFSGNSGDRIEVTVTGEGRKAEVDIADGSLRKLASGLTTLKFRLPQKGPDAEAYYIIFRDAADKPARFTVKLTRAGTA